MRPKNLPWIHQPNPLLSDFWYLYSCDAIVYLWSWPSVSQCDQRKVCCQGLSSSSFSVKNTQPLDKHWTRTCLCSDASTPTPTLNPARNATSDQETEPEAWILCKTLQITPLQVQPPHHPTRYPPGGRSILRSIWVATEVLQIVFAFEPFFFTKATQSQFATSSE